MGADRARLPRGTHGLDPAVVAKSQRNRILFGVLESVAERGYAATTVADIVSRANVSRRTFYELYRGRDDCFVAAFESAVGYVIGQLAASVADVPRKDWRALIRGTLTTYLQVLADNAPCARALHVECLAAGSVVGAQRRQMKVVLAGRMSAVFRIGRAAGDIPVEIPQEAFDALIGAIDDRIRDCLEFEGPQQLPALAPHLYEITLALFGTPEWLATP